MSRLSGSVGSSYRRSSSVTNSFPSSSATQSAAIRLGTRLPSFTGAPGVKSIKRSSQSLPSFVNGSVQHQRIAGSTRTTASLSSSISSVMTRSSSWSSLSEDGKSVASSTWWDPYHSSSSAVQSTAIAGAPSYVHHQQSAGRTWTTASSSSSIYYPTTKSHSATSANDAMTRSWSSSSTSRQGTGAATSSTTSTRWWMQEDPPSVDGVSTTSTSYTRAVASSRSSYMVPSSGGPSLQPWHGAWAGGGRNMGPPLVAPGCSSTTAASSHRGSANPTGGGSRFRRPEGSNVARVAPENWRCMMNRHPAVPIAVSPAVKITPQPQTGHPRLLPAGVRNILPNQGYSSHVSLQTAGSTRFDHYNYQDIPNSITKAATQTQMRSGRRRVSGRWRPFMGCC